LAPAGEVRQRLQQALALAQPAQAWQLVGEATFWLGVVAINQGDAAQALAYDRQAIDYFKRTKQTGWQAIAYNNIAFHALRAGQPHLAHEQAGLGLELARQIGSLHTQGWLLSTLGEVEIYLDRLPEARTHLNEALALVSKWGPVRLEPGLLVDLAQVSMAGQDWEAAVSRLEHAQALARATAPQFLPSLEVALGQAYLGQGRPVMALSIAQQALIAAESKTQQGVAGMALRLLGQIHAAGGRQGQAREAFAASIERLSEIGDGLECARTHAAMGSWLASQGDPAAEALLQSARLAFEEAGASLYLRQFRVSAARR
jgi:tetratricopeptide (TPR) repeat protein